MGAKVPKLVYNSSGVLGQNRIPDSDFYTANVVSVTKNEAKPTSWVLQLMFENGFDTRTWLDLPFDAAGGVLPGFIDDDGNYLSEESERRYSGMIAAFKSAAVSAGLGRESDEDLDIEDLVGKKVHIEWHSGRDLGERYGRVAKYISAEQHATFASAGTKPTIKSVATSATETAVTRTVPSVSRAKVAMPNNGTATETARMAAPTPSRSARKVIPTIP